VRKRTGSFLQNHSLSLAAIGIVLMWIVLYRFGDPKSHWGSFFGNAIADWTGVVVTVIATKHLYEMGSAESRQPSRIFVGKFAETIRDHSLTIFLVLTGAAWIVLYVRIGDSSFPPRSTV